jgi:hypothetical protein
MGALKGGLSRTFQRLISSPSKASSHVWQRIRSAPQRLVSNRHVVLVDFGAAVATKFIATLWGDARLTEPARAGMTQTVKGKRVGSPAGCRVPCPGCGDGAGKRAILPRPGCR